MVRFHVEIQWESREEKHRSSKYKILLSFSSIAEACNKRDLQKGLWNRAIKINSNKKASGKKKLSLEYILLPSTSWKRTRYATEVARTWLSRLKKNRLNWTAELNIDISVRSMEYQKLRSKKEKS